MTWSATGRSVRWPVLVVQRKALAVVKLDAMGKVETLGP